jgi:hypothetical protein
MQALEAAGQRVALATARGIGWHFQPRAWAACCTPTCQPLLIARQSVPPPAPANRPPTAQQSVRTRERHAVCSAVTLREWRAGTCREACATCKLVLILKKVQRRPSEARTAPSGTGHSHPVRPPIRRLNSRARAGTGAAGQACRSLSLCAGVAHPESGPRWHSASGR